MYDYDDYDDYDEFEFDRCEECRLYGDDYFINDDGEYEDHCSTCAMNPFGYETEDD